ncbi:MAG: (Fe-S)-binding protein [Rhodanobacteraceae bacterium]
MPDSPRPARIAALADECVKCGLCLPHCPTYALDRTETESPRGRIALAAGATSGVLAPGFELRLHLDHCLGCMACERVCPVPVRYGELLTETRAVLPAAHGRPRFLLSILSRPGLLRFGAALARWTGAAHWLPGMTRAVLPANSALRAAIGLLPALSNVPPASDHARTALKTAAHPRGRVALFGGCVQGVFERVAQDAAARLLAAIGFEVVRIESLCCGALAAHTGDAARVDALAEQVRGAFDASSADVLLSATPGCLGTLRAALPERLVEDALAFLDAHGESLAFRPLPMRAALHLPCTQVNIARAGAAVQRLLMRVPGLRIEVLPTQAQCCGAAGTHMLEFPQRATAFRERVLATLPTPVPELLLTSNIGCRLHLDAGLRERRASIMAEHPITLLAQQLIA